MQAQAADTFFGVGHVCRQFIASEEATGLTMFGEGETGGRGDWSPTERYDSLSVSPCCLVFCVGGAVNNDRQTHRRISCSIL